MGNSTRYIPFQSAIQEQIQRCQSLMKAYGTDVIGAYTRALTGEYTRPKAIHLKKGKRRHAKIHDYNKWKNSGNKAM